LGIPSAINCTRIASAGAPHPRKIDEGRRHIERELADAQDPRRFELRGLMPRSAKVEGTARSSDAIGRHGVEIEGQSGPPPRPSPQTITREGERAEQGDGAFSSRRTSSSSPRASKHARSSRRNIRIRRANPRNCHVGGVLRSAVHDLGPHTRRSG
jgi:hypothetical protein